MLHGGIGYSAPSAASIANLIASVPALLWEADDELRVTFVSGNLAPAVSIRELFSSAIPACKVLEAHERALHGHTATFDMEFRGRCYHATVKPSEGEPGPPRGVIGIALDMTDRMVSERAFRISEHSFRSLIEDAPYAICQATVNGELLQVNRAMAEMLGYEIETASEVLLRDLPLVFSPAGAFESFSRAVLEQRSHAGAERAWIRRDGRLIKVWVSGRVVPGRAGETSHLEIFAEDITEKKRIEAEQVQAHKMQALGQLAGGIAHDFNNLLLVIGGHVEMLLADSEENGSRESLLAVKGAAERAAALTEQMLAFSRARASRVETVDLNELLRNLMSILSRLIREDIEFRLVTRDRPVFVRADPHEIERVVVNLAVNAQDAMPGGGRLTIEACDLLAGESAPLDSEKIGGGKIGGVDYVCLSVQDTGIGMDRDVQARAFEPFFTRRPGARSQSQGTGLGLSVVYGIVRRHHGHIGIESEPGQGATFRIYLPRAAAAEPARSEPVASPQILPGGSETILFAEDDPGIRRMLTPFLARLGYKVLAARNGVEAMEVAHAWPGEIHLLLTDVVMPGMGGPELADKLRAANRSGVRVLFISGYAGNIPEGVSDPMAGISLLQKPFSMDQLAGAVREALGVNAG